jgi:hypothetical protein
MPPSTSAPSADASTQPPPALEALLRQDGFVIVEAADMRALLPPPAVEDFGDFARSWDRLGDDRFMADGGRYRRRRHATFAVGPEGIVRKAHQPHYQSRDYNMLNGGFAFNTSPPIFAWMSQIEWTTESGGYLGEDQEAYAFDEMSGLFAAARAAARPATISP